MHALIRDFDREDRGIYWRDFCTDAVMGWGGFLLPLCVTMPWPAEILLLSIATRGFYGLLSYLHEFAHNRGGKALIAAWSILFGTPFLVHPFMYLEIHKHHHHPRGYATSGDGEYMTLAGQHRELLVRLLLWNLLLPFLGLIRFGVMVPVGFFSRRFRALVYRKFSMAGMKFSLERSGPTDDTEAADWRRQELMSASFCWLAAFGLVGGWLPVAAAAQWYVAMAAFATMNAVRGIAAHHYGLRNENSQVSLMAQLGDSLNVTGRGLSTWLFCPNGIQYHALHHIFPGIPYHALAAAHDRLIRNLPMDAPYHAVNVRSVWASWGGLIRSMKPGLLPWATEVAADHP